MSINIPNGYFGLVTGRSSIALKGIVTHVGIIDKDFFGSAKVILTNSGCCPQYSIMQGDRIGQITLCKYSKANWIENDSFKAKVTEWNNSTARDKHIGFGSTGIFETLTNAAISAMLKEKRNYPARLEQTVGKHLVTRVISIVEYNNQRSHSLCYCHKFSGCVPHIFYDNYYACEVCQMCTDYCHNVSFPNNFKRFIRFVKDILNRSIIIMRNIDKEEKRDPYNIKYKYFLLILTKKVK